MCLIEKPRTIPLYLQKLQALDRRLPAPHPKRHEIESELARWKAGFKGEQSIDYHLGFLDNDWIILHNLRLHDGIRFFQIDTLLITPALLILIEVKNIAGTLTFDAEFQQLIRADKEKEEAFQHPLYQTNRHKKQLKMWLDRHNVSPVPMETLVVMAHPRAVLKRSSGTSGMYHQIIPAYLLADKIADIFNYYPNLVLSKTEVSHLSSNLTTSHSESRQNPLHRYNIAPAELMKGVFCPVCSKTAMQRIHGSWKCRGCEHKSKSAHHKALQDYALLINPSISNQEAAAFLQVSSSHTVKRLLQSLSYPVVGTGRALKYTIIVE